MPGRIDAITSPAPSADAERAIEDFSALVARAGVILRVRRENAVHLGPAIRLDVRELGDLSHLHVQALVRILSRRPGLTAEMAVPNRRKPFVLPHDAQDCMHWFRADRGSSAPRLWSTINRVVDLLRADR
jgi:hypothetical protein